MMTSRKFLIALTVNNITLTMQCIISNWFEYLMTRLWSLFVNFKWLRLLVTRTWWFSTIHKWFRHSATRPRWPLAAFEWLRPAMATPCCLFMATKRFSQTFQWTRLIGHIFGVITMIKSIYMVKGTYLELCLLLLTRDNKEFLSKRTN